MKKLSNFWKWSCCALLAVSLAACYNDDDIRAELGELAGRVEQLEAQVNGLNSSMATMQTILSNLERNVYVAKVETLADGYRIYFTDGTSAEIKNGKDGANGANGAQGATGPAGQNGKDAPTIGVKQDTDGIYYWTLTSNGTTSWLTDNSGKKMPVSGTAPILNIDAEGYWTISYDGGATFTRMLGPDGQPVKVLQDSAFFQDVTCDNDTLHITLADGTTIDIPCSSNFYLLFADAAESETFQFGETRTFSLESVGVERIVITKPDEWKVSLDGDTLTVTAPTAEHADCADLTGEIALIYFSASKLSSAISLQVAVEAPETIELEVLSTGLRPGNTYPGEMATITVSITPSKEDFWYHVTAYRIMHGDDEESYLETLVGTLNFSYFGDAWEIAVASGNVRKGIAESFEIPFLYEGDQYRVIACGVKKNADDVVEATTDVFYTEIITTPTSIEDLGANGTSNTYIVTKPDTKYRFDAKVQGNGQSTPGITPKAIDPKRAFIVWETGSTKNAVIKELELGDDGYITFTTGDVINGNALIAVTDGEPTDDYSLGTILWSWHIWAIDYTADKDKKVINHDGEEFMMMDCNLGDWDTGTTISALSQFWGMKYQWGRKDPFIYFPYGTNAATVTHEEDYIWERTYSYASTAEETLQDAISNPTVYFQGGYSTSNDWYGTSTGAANRNNNLWGNGEADAKKAVKTIYDPCPAGYMVPPVEAFSGFFANGLDASSLTSSSDNMNVDGTCNAGWNFITSGSDYSFFPLAGYMSNGSIYSITRTACYLTSTPSTASTSNTQIRQMRIETTGGYFNTANRADGNTVRCVRE